MTDPTHSDDEAISSYLDGEATFDEVARIEADPELLAQVQELGAVAELLSTPVAPLPQPDVDRLIDNALDQSSTSRRITDLGAVRAGRFNPQRLAAVAAALVILGGAVGALVVFNADGDETMSAETFAERNDMADDSVVESDESADDYSADDSAQAFDVDMDDMATAGEETPEFDDMADDGEDMADDEGTGEFVDGQADTPAADDSADSADTPDTADSADSTRFDLGIADSYRTLDDLIAQTGSRWQELVATAAVPAVDDNDEQEGEQRIAEQALAELPCGQIYISTFDQSAGGDLIAVGATVVAGTPVTVVVIRTSVDTAELLTAAEPDCTFSLRATLNP